MREVPRAVLEVRVTSELRPVHPLLLKREVLARVPSLLSDLRIQGRVLHLLTMPKLIKKFGLYIWNLKKDKKIPASAVFVGRPTSYGNPFAISKFGRDGCLEKYREYVIMGNTRIAANAKRELRGKDLVCFCAQLACHAEVLMEIANGD